MTDFARLNARAGQHAIALVTHSLPFDPTAATHREMILHITETTRLVSDAARDVGTSHLVGALIGLCTSLVREAGDDGTDRLHEVARRLAVNAARLDT